MGSLQKRYIIASITLLIVVAACFFWASWFVEHSSARSVASMEHGIHAQNLSLGIRDSVWRADFSLYAYLLEPSESLKKEVSDNLEAALNKSQIFSNSKPISLVLDHMDTSSLTEDVELLRDEAVALMSVRSNRQQRFPAFIRITESLYPSSLEFLTATSLAMESMHGLDKNSYDSYEYRLLANIRRTWSRMISSFRLFLAYRTGMMGISDKGMALHSQNIDIFYAGISDDITQLQILADNSQISFQGEDSLPIMIHISRKWYNSYQDVLKIQISDEWKLDEPILLRSVQPLSASINNTLNLIEEKLADSRKKEIYSLAQTANSVIKVFWIIAFIVMSIVILGYIYIKRGVIDPISSVASAMKQQALNEHVATLDSVSTEEIQSLILAFNYLSQSLKQIGSDRDKAEDKARQAAKMSVIGEMASCIGHEINNPLNNMMRLSELMAAEVASLNVQCNLSEDIKTLQMEQQRCADIVQELLNFGRPRLPSIDRSDLLILIKETAHLLSPLAAEKSINLYVPENSELPLVYVDSSQIKQVLINLVINAIEASEPGSAVEVSLGSDGDGLNCEVSDRGCGVDPDQINHIFEPFYTTKLKEKGLGLGLAICFSIVRNHGGMMGSQLRDGGGLSIWFTIPRESELALLENSYERNS